MKARLIELKSLAAVPSEDAACDYRDMLLLQLNRVDPQAGLSFSDIEKRLELRKSLKEAGDTWVVAEDDWQLVQTLLKSERWVMVSENLTTFIKDVMAAPEAEVGAKNGLSLAGS